MNGSARVALATLLIGLLAAAAAATQPDGDSLSGACAALEDMIARTGEASLAEFSRAHLSPAFRASLSPAEMTALLRRIREAAGDFGGVELHVRGEDLGRAVFHCNNGKVTVDFDVDAESGRIERLELVAVEQAPEIAPITWADLADRLSEEEENGFSGSVLVARDGTIVLERGYGYADREHGVPVDSGTIFAIGSTPIDFTHAAILKLEEMGKLDLDDPLSRFLPDVPGDKAGITLRHLMTGASGLPDFHDTEEDADPDLAWIDRQTAIGRILRQPLLFAPGTASRHSHSAWGLLAAIVELVSGRPYERFLQERFFVPAGMTRTGCYPLTANFDPREIAIGYGTSQPTAVNSPAHWGPTSWLVMGSGGMVSTAGDLYRWHVALRQGRLLGPSALAKYPLDAVGVGGNDRGFLNWFAHEGDDSFVLCSNSHQAMDDLPAQVGRALERLIAAGR